MDRFTKRGLTYSPRILITGDTGFLANNTIKFVKECFPKADLILLQGSKFFDLTIQNHVKVLFENIRKIGGLDYVLHMAALSGGIEDNRNRQASYAYQNSMMLWHIVEEAAISKVRKLLLFLGSCGYPESLASPMKEENFWDGLPTNTSLGYSAAKKMGQIAAFAYNQQTGLKTSCLMPSNIFGPYDNFDEKSSHVIPGLIRKFVEAKEEGYGTVTLWGSGKAERDFLYAEDVGRLLPYFMKYQEKVSPINISSNKGTSIAEVADLISNQVGYTGKIHYDRTKPDGQLIRILDNSKLLEFLSENNIAWEPTPLEEAIGITVEWYKERVNS